MFVDNKCRYLIDNLDDDNQSRPDPQPQWNLKGWQKSYSTTRNKADVCHAVQYSTGLTLGMQSPRQVPIGHITDAAQAIDYPESRTLRITEQKTDGPKESEDSYYVGNVFHPLRFSLAFGLRCQMALTIEQVSFSGHTPQVS